MVYHYFVLLGEREKSPHLFDQHSFLKHSIYHCEKFLYCSIEKFLSYSDVCNIDLTQATRKNNPL